MTPFRYSPLLATGLFLLSTAAPASTNEAGKATVGIRGHRHFIHHTSEGKQKVTVDLSSVPIEAWAQGADGSFFHYPGTGASDGTFVVPGIPPGATYTLRVGDELPWFSSVERRLDLSEHKLGRVGQRTPDSSTHLVFDVGAMRPWLPGDLLQLISANAGMVVIDLHGGFDEGAPTAGNTELAQASFNLAWSSENRLVDSAQGDSAMLTHLATSATGDSRSLTEVFIPAPFTTPEGQSTLLQGGFTEVAQTEQFSYEFHEAAFTPAIADVHPRAERTPGRQPELGVSVLPAGKGPGFFSSIPDLLEADLHEGSPALPLRYGNPFPREWPAVVSVVYPVSVTFALAGTQPTRQSAGVSYTNLLRKVEGQPLAPLLTPVRSLSIDGAVATVDQTMTSLTPTLSWSAPAAGTPSAHEVSIRRLFVSGTRTVAALGVRIRTAQSHVTLPPGVLVPGASYIMSVRAFRQGDLDLSRHPLRTDFPVANATAFTGILTAP
ncbi:hypothetical protein HUA74_15575 [Myxococcus sp. CA051A]|uniref:hypothetical protein n=1 Tax=Myxococcus sp. CA051A TaxID=2741739 RepID=UPI00157B8A8B|nr:hypothetical protein [Myxococcus sp. CA051A]NTX62080.1 hypothetical protein [Myxococcus sp. CA051A]